MTKLYKATILILSVWCTACTETMDIDFNNVESQIVIEGKISNIEAGVVNITRSIPYDLDNTFPGVAGAEVSITDSEGNYTVLSETETGIYTNSSFIGKVGEIYHLNVSIDEQIYTSSNKVPELVPLDSVTVTKKLDDSFFGASTDSIYEIRVYFQDPAGTDNFYQFIEYRNNKQEQSYIISDNSADGNYLDRRLRYSDRELEPGDILKIEMRCISEEVYDYFNDLNSVNAMSATPTNPTNNIEGATLGYFSTYTSQYTEKLITQ